MCMFCMYVWMYVCTYVRTYVRPFTPMHVNVWSRPPGIHNFSLRTVSWSALLSYLITVCMYMHVRMYLVTFLYLCMLQKTDVHPERA